MDNSTNKDNSSIIFHVKQVLYDYNKFTHKIGKYSSEPQYILLEEQDKVIHAIAKVFNGPAGNKILLNEYICYQLAQTINIPIPESGICFIDEKTIIGPNDHIKEKNYGFSFYSTYVNTIERNSHIIQNISNLEAIIRIILFDHIIFNTDRNDENILVQRKSDRYKLLAIDHTHVFKGGPDWNPEKLIKGIKNNDYKSDYILSKNNEVYNLYCKHININREKFENEVKFIKSRINREIIINAILDCPNEWIPQGFDMRVLADYLMYRIDHIDEIISLIVNYICDK